MADNTTVIQLLVADRVFNCGCPTGQSYRCHFSWTITDPAAVRVIFDDPRNPDGNPEWIFARDLLMDGLTFPIGHGDVEVIPLNSKHDEQSVLEIRLTSREGTARFHFDAADITDFLSATIRIVAPNEEEIIFEQSFDDVRLTEWMETS
jgi:hypothetical protein